MAINLEKGPPKRPVKKTTINLEKSPPKRPVKKTTINLEKSQPKRPDLRKISPKRPDLISNDYIEQYSWWKYDNEYITGWQYFGRSFVGFLLAFFIIGMYLLSVTAYKRANSLGHDTAACNRWSIWGFLVVPLAFTPIAFFTNTLPYWYLWFSSGPGKTFKKN